MLTQGAEVCIQRVRQLPADHVTAVPVNDGNKVHKPLRHRAVRYVSAPHLIRSYNVNTVQQIRINLVLLAPQAGARLWTDSLYAHQPHKPLYTLPVNRVSLSIQPRSYLTTAVKRCSCILLINQPHQVQVYSTFLSWRSLVIPA